MTTKQKLELTWIGKDKTIKVEPRILVHDGTKDYGDKSTDNMLIYGDNLLALKALEQEYAGKVKCIYIDPPYNTGSAFAVYDDNQEHSIWLSLMKPRLEILRNLLTEDGSIYVNIDFNEVHYLKVLMDEVFGRTCFQREIIWRMGWLSGFKTTAKNYIRNHDTILFYTKSPNNYFFNKEKAYTSPSEYQERFNSTVKKDILKKLTEQGISESEALSLFDYLQNVGLPQRYPLEDTWNCSIYDKLNSINVVSFSGEKVSKMLGVAEVKGQKSEALVKRIFDIATQPGDLVLDSFLGSGTTAAVAHKMGRKYIGIELGEHCHTHCIPRLQKVIDGTDQGGISKTVGWKGGGGFKYYYLAPSLLNKDKYGQYIISKEYNADMLAAAMAKHEGFLYSPDQDQFWKQGKSSENDYIYTTTNHVGADVLAAIASEMKDGESLLICCKSFDAGVANGYSNITVKKIPGAILGSCEFDKANYNLNIINPPVIDEEE